MGFMFSSLIPVLFIIAAGFALRALGIIKLAHWEGLERATYLIFFPAVLIESLAKADLSKVPAGALFLVLFAAVAIMGSLLFVLRPALESRFDIRGPAFTSVFQGATRWNSFVALALGANLYGSLGLTLVAVAVAAMVPVLNIMATIVLTRYGDKGSSSTGGLRKSLTSNPFLWACAIGVVINLAKIPIPDFVMSTTHILGGGALAAGLLVVGAGLEGSRLRRPGPATLIAIALKLLVMPLIVFGLAKLAGLSGQTLGIAMVAASMPSASSSYLMARNMGGDAPLMAEILTAQTILAALTIPLMLAIFSSP